MILPIVAYGNKILTTPAEDLEELYPWIPRLIEDMYDTMSNAGGVGLAAPQINEGLRLFVTEVEDVRRTFINPIMLEESGEEWTFEEGCLSIPGIRGDVKRKPKIVIEYFDENFQLREEAFEGIEARVIQHEYDHIEGILFLDKLDPLRKVLLKGKLKAIATGKINPRYKMILPGKTVK